MKKLILVSFVSLLSCENAFSDNGEDSSRSMDAPYLNMALKEQGASEKTQNDVMRAVSKLSKAKKRELKKLAAGNNKSKFMKTYNALGLASKGVSAGEAYNVAKKAEQMKKRKK